MTKSGSETQICRGFTDGQWLGLKTRLFENGAIQNDQTAWDCAITVFERRIRERYFSCIEALQAADSRADIELGDTLPPDCSVLVQPEMERRRSPLVSIPPFGRGFTRHRYDHQAIPSAWLRPRRARFRFARQDHCSSTMPIRLNFRVARRSPIFHREERGQGC